MEQKFFKKQLCIVLKVAPSAVKSVSFTSSVFWAVHLIIVMFQAGLSAAPTRALSAVKNMNLPQQLKDIKLPELPQAIKDLKLWYQ